MPDPDPIPVIPYRPPPPPPRLNGAERAGLFASHALLVVVGGAFVAPLAVGLVIVSGSPTSGGAGLPVVCCGVPALVGLFSMFVGLRGIVSLWRRFDGKPHQ